ncbi:MAG: hypothetical protein M1827_002698 [Pycnora praestabilis]|nr:MAG: hypothetical protein M1827_002698 [Pycnora praestabilis]
MLLTLISILASLAVTTFAQQQGQPQMDFTQAIASNANLTNFTALIKDYGDIYATLSFTSDITILAPSNDAFAKISYSSLGPAFANNETDEIRALLYYHVVNGTYTAAQFNGTFKFLPTWLNNATYANVTGGQEIAVVEQSPGVVVFISGQGSRSTLTTTDIMFGNGGVIQIIDTFNIIPQNFLNTAPTFNLTGIGGAVANANVSDYVDMTTDLTVFAPWNIALQNIGSALVDMSVQDLGELLKYHVVNGTIPYYTSNIQNGTILKSLQGGNLSISFASNSFYVNSAKIIQQDILLSNGIMHVIDNVLDPNATAVLPNPAIPTQPPIIQGSMIDIVPFSSDLPSTVSSSFVSTAASAAPTTTGEGSAASSTLSGAAASTTDGSASPTKTKKAGAGRVERRGLGLVLGAVLAVAVWGAW